MYVVIDDSKSFGRGGIVCLAALSAAEGQWKSLHERWAALLDQNEIRWLHTSDFLSSNSEYAKFHNKPFEERIEIVGQFADTIREHIPFACVVAVDSDAFKSATRGFKKRLKAEDLCFARVFAYVWKKFEQSDHKDIINFTVDDDPSQSQRFLGMWHSLRRKYDFARAGVASITFADDKFLAMLQAADLVASSYSMEFGRGDAAWQPDSPLRRFSLVSNPGKVEFTSECWQEEDFKRNINLLLEAAKHV